MPAARYWRLIGIETYADGDLELSELQLYDSSGRADAAATLTATVEPIFGALANLKDGDTATVCRFSGSAVRSGGFLLAWDFGIGSGVDVIGLRLGASSHISTFMAACILQYSSDGVGWLRQASYGQYEYPGPNAYINAPVAPTLNDPHLANVSLLMPFDAADGSTIFTDLSPSQKTISVFGNSKISSAQSKFGGTSAYFDGGGDYLSATDDGGFTFGAGDFTIEAWMRFNTVESDMGLIAGSESGAFACIITQFQMRLFRNGVGTDSAAGFQRNVGVWYHLAWSRNASTLRFFVGGIKVGEVSNTVSYGSGGGVVIGASNATTRFFNGWIDDLRVTKGVGRYTDNFTPQPLVSVSGGPVFVDSAVHAQSAVGAQVAASSPVSTHSAPLAAGLQLARDIEHGGPGTIYGTTKTKGMPNQPTHARVVLLHQRSKLPVRETWSDPITGAFAFTGIDTTQQFLTLAEDVAGNFRPVAANRLTPEVLP